MREETLTQAVFPQAVFPLLPLQVLPLPPPAGLPLLPQHRPLGLPPFMPLALHQPKGSLSRPLPRILDPKKDSLAFASRLPQDTSSSSQGTLEDSAQTQEMDHEVDQQVEAHEGPEANQRIGQEAPKEEANPQEESDSEAQEGHLCLRLEQRNKNVMALICAIY